MIAQFEEYNFTAVLTEENYKFKETDEQIKVAFNDDSFVCNFSNADFVCDFGGGVSGGDYDGPYMITPSQQTQTLQTAGKTLSQNVTVKPIPQNYGLITYNGSYIKVS